MSVPDPPDPFDCAVDRLPAGGRWYRAHARRYPGGEFNPARTAPNRWSPFGDPVVPVLYLADRPEAAVFETVLRDVVPGSVVPVTRVRGTVISVLTQRRVLTVARLHSDGLTRLGVLPEDLTATRAETYPDTVAWAQAAHATGVHGISYMCHRYNAARAVVLFGDLCPGGAVRADPAPVRDFADPADLERLRGLAAGADVTLTDA